MQDTPQLSEAKRALLEQYRRGAAALQPARRATIPRRAPDALVPLSYGQQQLWLVDQLVPDAPVYNECVTIHLPGPLDVAVFERSFNEVLRRHEIWRSTFPTVDGQPVQRIHPHAERTLPLVDLMALPAEERAAESVRLATIEARQPFDLAEGPLLRATLMRLDEQEHRLYLALHHIIFDGVAIYQGFLPEVRTIYEAFLAGQPSPLPEPPIQYGDYAVWQRDYLRAETMEPHLAYWRQKLGGRLPVLQLPADRPRPATESFRGSMLPFALSWELTAALEGLARREGCTLYMVLLAAYNTLLYRYSGQEDILVGTATAGRNRPELRTMIGYFLTTVVMRTDLSGNPTFRVLLRRVREVTIEGVAHEELPFDFLVRELQPERTLTHNPLFQALLTLEPPLPVLECGWTLTQMDVETGISKFDLSLEMDNRPEGLIGRFEYNGDLFDSATIQRMSAQWQTLLEGIVADPGQTISALPLLPEAERRQLLDDWNDTARDYPREATIHRLFEQQAERTPDAVAVVFEQESLTYGELSDRANRLARHLRGLGVGPETLVGICVDRSLEMLIGLLGILKAGGAYVPLDPAFPPDRIAYMLDDAQAPVLVAQQRTAAALPPHGARVVLLDADWPEIAQQVATNPDVGAGAENLAYVIYTSGSTGRPKGVQIPHRAVVNFLRSMAYQPGLGAEDRLLAVTTLSFDIAGLELFLPLSVGACVVIASREVATSGPALSEALAASGATVMQATPATWRLLLAVGWRGDGRLKALCGGEALPPELAQQLAPCVNSLWNMYGPTETTIWSAICKVEPECTISIGQPIANTRLYVLDACGGLAPIGVPGELHIGGDGLARGYLNRPELTAEKFIADPFSGQPGARLYRTGDLARYRAGGTLEFLGRLDNQVKVRGYRIELGEIEAALASHPRVRQNAVVVRDDQTGEKRLAAYIVPDGTEAVTSGELRQFLKETLPDYMVPSAFVTLAELPLTPNGKVDRRALPAPGQAATPACEESYVAPNVTLHYQLVQIWEELLEARPIGIRDNFFDLGGHSLLAARLVERIAQVCGQRIPLAALFAGATIEHLAALLLAEAEHDGGSSIVCIQAGGARTPLFFLHGDFEGGGFYCANLARHLDPDQPFYAVQPHGLDGGAVPYTVEAMAAFYVRVLREARPEGPYALGGFCAGGLVAFEMARLLRRQGREVELVLLVNPASDNARARLGRALIDRAGRLLGRSIEERVEVFLRLRDLDTAMTPLLALAPRERIRRGREIMRQRLQQALRRAGGANVRGVRAPAVTRPRREELLGRYTWATAAHTTKPYAGRVALIWSDEGEPRREEVTRQWRQALPRVETYETPGTHLTAITRHADALARRMAACLDTAPEARTEPITQIGISA